MHPLPTKQPSLTPKKNTRIAPELHPTLVDGDALALIRMVVEMLLTRVLPISLATLALRGALMTIEAPLLALVRGCLRVGLCGGCKRDREGV